MIGLLIAGGALTMACASKIKHDNQDEFLRDSSTNMLGIYTDSHGYTRDVRTNIKVYHKLDYEHKRHILYKAGTDYIVATYPFSISPFEAKREMIYKKLHANPPKGQIAMIWDKDKYNRYYKFHILIDSNGHDYQDHNCEKVDIDNQHLKIKYYDYEQDNRNRTAETYIDLRTGDIYYRIKSKVGDLYMKRYSGKCIMADYLDPRISVSDDKTYSYDYGWKKTGLKKIYVDDIEGHHQCKPEEVQEYLDKVQEYLHPETITLNLKPRLGGFGGWCKSKEPITYTRDEYIEYLSRFYFYFNEDTRNSVINHISANIYNSNEAYEYLKEMSYDEYLRIAMNCKKNSRKAFGGQGYMVSDNIYSDVMFERSREFI